MTEEKPSLYQQVKAALRKLPPEHVAACFGVSELSCQRIVAVMRERGEPVYQPEPGE